MPRITGRKIADDLRNCLGRADRKVRDAGGLDSWRTVGEYNDDRTFNAHRTAVLEATK